MLSKIENIVNLNRWLHYKWVRVSLVYLISILYALALGYFLAKDKPHLIAIPLGMTILFMAFYRFEWIYWMTLFFVPMSFPLKELMPGLGINMFLPTEPLMVGLMILFFIRLALDGGFDKRVVNHPITQVIILQLLWILITTLTSSMPDVSVKFLIARLWFVSVFFFLAIALFKNPPNIRRYLWVYLIPLAGMVIVITYKHIGLGLFDQKASNPAVDPFFNDHTLYGAIMAMMIPIAIGYLAKSQFVWWQKVGIVLVLALLFAGLLFSYSRAAWVSLLGGLGVYALVYFKIPGKTVLFGFAGLVVAFLLFGSSLLMKMERNDQDSSDNLTEHVQSISNISTDASNLERLNRWSCALRMWAEKPIFGFGPGTYMFQYAPYQKDSQKTIISTNAGDGGNAHSEYLGPLSEMGVVGTLLILILVTLSIRTGIRVYYRLQNRELKMVAMSVTIGLITYYLHGILNNFLDTDKASAGVWGFMAILVALDLASREKERLES